MTAFAFILGVVPLVIATGPGAEMRRSLGTAVFSGMLGVTIVGLFLTPVFYVVLRKLFPVRVRPANRWLKAILDKTILESFPKRNQLIAIFDAMSDCIRKA